MSNCLIDITTFNAIGSIFSGKTIDPRAYDLAGNIADAFIYNDNISYVVPNMGETIQRQEPDILMELITRDENIILAKELDLKDQIELKEDSLEKTFTKFKAWLLSNKTNASLWLKLHNEKWIKDRRPNPNDGFFHDLSKVKKDKKRELDLLNYQTDIQIEDLLYLYDVMLRYPSYGKLVEVGDYYLNHPIREAIIDEKEIIVSQNTEKAIPISFSKYINFLLRKKAFKSIEEFALTLHLLRHEVRDKKIHTQSSSSIDKSVLEEIYRKGKLHPRLKYKALAILLIPLFSGISGVSDQIYSVLAGTGVGVGLTASAHFWSGILPKGAADIKWLKWALHWEVPKSE